MQQLKSTRTTIIAGLSREIDSISNRNKTRKNKERLRFLRAERTAYERGNRMPPMRGTDRNYSEPYAYLITITLEHKESGDVFTRDITILWPRRLTLKRVRARAYEIARTWESVTVKRVVVESALHHA